MSIKALACQILSVAASSIDNIDPHVEIYSRFPMRIGSCPFRHIVAVAAVAVTTAYFTCNAGCHPAGGGHTRAGFAAA